MSIYISHMNEAFNEDDNIPVLSFLGFFFYHYFLGDSKKSFVADVDNVWVHTLSDFYFTQAILACGRKLMALTEFSSFFFFFFLNIFIIEDDSIVSEKAFSSLHFPDKLYCFVFCLFGVFSIYSSIFFFVFVFKMVYSYIFFLGRY